MSKHKLDDASLSKGERKRLNKGRRQAAAATDGTIYDSPAAPLPVLENRENGKYRPHQDLDSQDQSTIDEYLSSQLIRIDDPQFSGLRPILKFSQLPTEIATQFQSTFQAFEKPSTIQSTTWPFLLSGRDVVGVAETGSGKTIAFGLPLVVSLAKLKKRKGVRALVVTPTRELAIQVFEQVEALAKVASDLKAVCIYGGTSKEDQRKTINGANIIVATPGRLKDFMNDGSIDVSKTKYLVLDEADRMLDRGFEDDIKEIISHMPPTPNHQTAMFTATWPKSIRDLAATFMNHPVKVTIGRTDQEDSGELRANVRIKQVVEVVDGFDKQQRLLQLLKQHHSGPQATDRILIFCLYKKEATRIESFLHSRGLPVSAIHGDMSQHARLASLESFKSGNITLLVATDIAARGLDIPNVKLVINLTFPLTAEDYVHRIGRTGRAGADGLAITLFTEQDKGLAGALINVLKAAHQPVPDALLKFGTTVKKKQHESYGAFFKEAGDGKTATRITFDE